MQHERLCIPIKSGIGHRASGIGHRASPYLVHRCLPFMFPFGLAACGDKAGGDTGDIPTDDPYECIEMESVGNVSPGLSWGSAGICSVYHDSYPVMEPFITPGDGFIVDLDIYGEDSSLLPAVPVRLLAVSRDPGAYPSNENVVSDDLTAVGTTGDWSAAGFGSLGSLNSCHPNCEWHKYFVEIKDTSRAAADPDQCDDYVPTVRVCTDWAFSTRRAAPVYSTCESGSGRFQLVPHRTINRDHDGDRAFSLRAIQISGSGTMTSAAWVNKVDIVEDQGATLRVVKLNKAFRFDNTDHLQTPTDTVALVQSSTTLNNGVVTGGAPFLIEDVDADTINNFQVDMEWSCGTLQPQEEVSSAQGFTFSLADIGCYGSWPQKVVVRPTPFGTPDTLQVQLYGMVEDSFFVPLVEDGGEWDFTFTRRGLAVSGALLSLDQQGASVRLDAATFKGVSLCDADTYLLPPEE